MKTLKYLAIVVAGFFFFAACQKELSFETGFGNVAATGSLKSSSGDCQPITISGLYTQDSDMGDSNYVTVMAHITTPGNYKIYTDLQNGISFQDSGLAIDTGLQSIKLKAKGKPTLAENTDFRVTFNNSTCTFTIPVIGAVGANYSLVGSPTSCTNATIQGTYKVGTPLGTANKVILQVNVASVGGYSIATSTVNGMKFSTAGNFTKLGSQPVTLQASGTPTKLGNATMPVTAGTSNCSFVVNVAAADTTGTGGGGTPITDINKIDTAWKFSQGLNSYQGHFDDVAITDSPNAIILELYGLNKSQDTGMVIFVAISGASKVVKTGTYKTSTNSIFEFYKNNANLDLIYEAHPGSTGVEVTVVITAYNDITKVVEGTFNGTALNPANQKITITGGKFKAKVP